MCVLLIANRFNHTSWVTAVTPTDRPKSVRNSCVIKVFGGVFILSRCFLDYSVGVGVFVTGLSQISSFFSHCSTTILSKHITSALTAVKYHVMKYSETAFSNSNVNYFWSIKNSSEVIEKLRLRNFQGSQVSSFDFSTLYTSLPQDLINAKVLSLVNWCFNRVKILPLYFT